MVYEGQTNFGLQEASRNEQLAVSTSSVIVCDRRPETNPRKVIVVRNRSAAAADIIWVNLGQQSATSGQGIKLGQNESFSFSANSGNLDSIKREVWQDGITAICETVNGVLTIFEW